MRRILVVLIGVILLTVGILLLFGDAYGDQIHSTAKAVAVNAVATKINQALREGIYDGQLEGPLLDVQRDADGTIQYIETNSRLVNKLVLSFSAKMEENYNLHDTMVIPVNLGVLTGSSILSQLPVTTNVKVMPLSLTKFQAETEFVTEGINQTRYKVYCSVTSTVQILAPFSKETAEITRKVLLAEAIIIGDVPENYVFVPEEDILDVNDLA